MMEERTNSPAARLYRSMFLIRRIEEDHRVKITVADVTENRRE